MANNNLSSVSTKDLVAELRAREGVEACNVEPEWKYEIVVETTRPHPRGMPWGEHLAGGMHEGLSTGPAIILVVTD